MKLKKNIIFINFDTHFFIPLHPLNNKKNGSFLLFSFKKK